MTLQAAFMGRFANFSKSIIFTFALWAMPAKAQLEWVTFAGTSHYSGDLGGSFSGSGDFSELNFASTRLAMGSGLRVFVTPHLAFRGSIFYGKVSADDKYTDNIHRRNRNLNFFSPIFGANATAEFHFALGRGNLKRFYFLAGMDYFYFNPQTVYNGGPIELQPLGTEGQYYMPDKSPYTLYAPALVAGGGVRLFYTARGALGLEITGHRTFTDYLDDVSTSYPDKTALMASNGQAAVDLSDRNLGLVPGATEPGLIRGNPGVKDNFYFVSLCYHHLIVESKKNRAAAHSRGGRGAGGKGRCFEF